MFNKSLYIPLRCVIKKAKKLTPDTKLFTVALKRNDYKPGQFVQFSLLGHGEVPISIASSPTRKGKGYLEFLVRSVGRVTSAIWELSAGDEIGIRGPYGNGFPVEEVRHNDLIFISGGCGIAPLRSVIHYVFDKRKDYGDITILYGARTNKDIVFKREFYFWKSEKGSEIHMAVEKEPAPSGCRIGVVTDLFEELKNIKNKKIFMCGPPVMVYHSVRGLLKHGASAKNIFVTLERHIKCGVGKCGHCYIGKKYVCTDGPVFSLKEMRQLGVNG